jgi:hypothetical protein
MATVRRCAVAADRPPVSGEPSTEWGAKLLDYLRRVDPAIVPFARQHILAIEAEARATPPSLDVDRLASVLHRLYPSLRKAPTGIECDHAPVYGHKRTECRFDADEIAAEYARLSSESRPTSDSGEPPA